MVLQSTDSGVLGTLRFGLCVKGKPRPWASIAASLNKILLKSRCRQHALGGGLEIAKLRDMRGLKNESVAQGSLKASSFWLSSWVEL